VVTGTKASSAGRGAKHRGGLVVHWLVPQQRRQGPLLIGDRVPNDESGLHSLEHVAAPSDSVEEDPAMACIVCAVVMAVGADWPE
jgi:hypothetical protein